MFPGQAGLLAELGRQVTQRVVDQRQELPRGLRLALLNGAQNTGDLGHEAEDNTRCNVRQAIRVHSRFCGFCRAGKVADNSCGRASICAATFP